LAATDNDAYNTLICTDLGPEFGRNQVFQVGRHEGREDDRDLPVTLGGRGFGPGWSVDEYGERYGAGWRFRVTKLTEAFGPEAYREANPDAVVLGAIGKGGGLRFSDPKQTVELKATDRVLAFSPPE
ncbi:MAG: sodium:proton antiporter, partial [Pseudomonadota bacterium]